MMLILFKEYGEKNISVAIKHLNKNGPIVLALCRKYFNKYRKKQFPLAFKNYSLVAKKEKEWIQWLNKQKLTHAYFSLIKIKPASNFSFKVKLPRKNTVDWRFIFQEYHFMTYSTILEKLRQ